MKKLTILKIGGNVLGNSEKLNTFLDTFEQLEGHKWLVHGGGKRATQLAEKLDIPSQFIDGRRVTTAELLDVVIDVYSGINKRLVALLQSRKLNALGLCGADLNTISAKKRISNPIDFGFVGDIIPQQLNAQFIDFLLNSGTIPVFSPLSFDAENQTLLNTNADTIAQHLAVAHAEILDIELILAFEKPGVLLDINDEKSIIQELSEMEFNTFKADGKIADGMIPKLENGFLALKSGVKSVRITAFDKLSGGTKLIA